ncbi:MAG: redoxin domain-containing protein, partial [Woeseia sp.]
MNLRPGLTRSTALAMLLASIALAFVTPAPAADAAALPASAADVKPLTSGDQAPAFTVRTVDNEIYQFDPANLARPTILISFRGGWCPYCNLHLSELRNVIPEIKALGVDVLFLSGDRPDQLYSSLQADTQEDIDGRDYVILSDARSEEH